MLEKAVRGHQLGCIRGGGADPAAAAVRAVFEHGRQLCVPVAVVFADLNVVIYSVLIEEVAGRLLTTEARQAALACIGFSPAAIAVFEAQVALGHPTHRAEGMGTAWSALCLRHRLRPVTRHIALRAWTLLGLPSWPTGTTAFGAPWATPARA